MHAAAWAEAREVVSSGKHTLLYVCTCVEEFTYAKPHEPSIKTTLTFGMSRSLLTKSSQ